MDQQDLRNRFTYHPPQPGQEEKYEKIRMFALEFAMMINHLCPESHEKSLAITHLEDVVYCANAAIARHEKPPIEDGLPSAIAGDSEIP